LKKDESLELAYTGVVLEDGEGVLWLGTYSGLVRFDPESETLTTFLEPMTGLDIVMALHQDRAGRLWVGTLNGGIHLFDRESGTSSYLTQRDGLAHDRIYNILEDDDGRLWLSTANGVSRFDPETLSFRNYGVEDGLQSQRFGGGAIRRSNGELLFGGDKGINAFYPDQVEDSPYPPQIVLTQLKIMNDVVTPAENSPLARDITIADSITLDHDQNVLSFEFAGLHFGQPAQNRYSYRLEPLDKDWIQAGTERHASYTNLRPGEYTFRVRAANSDGVWNEEGASIRLSILPPWWQTWWAYALFVVVALLGFLVVHAFQRNQVVKRERERAREKENELRAEAAEAQAKVAEAEAKALRIENERTAQELEEARLLQLSMLPVQIPDPPNLEIATFMKTATEVGGDYYDFDLSPDGTLTVAIGDATGHGTRAGTMVTATKVLFNLLASEDDGVRVLRESTRIIRQLNMQNLFMSLALAKIRGNHFEIAGAGMPPTLIRRAGTDEVEEIELCGAPLGSFQDFPYQTASVSLNPGDTVVMMSDGLPEMIGDQDEVFGYDRVGAILRETEDLTPQGVIDRYSKVAAGWANGRPQDDDVTLIVMRMKQAA
jgi:serine phosphatase RsbU (regulator of sigma subunit)